MKIGIIGLGNFGRLMARHLCEFFEVQATDIVPKAEPGINFVSLDEITNNEIIILSVPMAALESTLHRIKDRLRPGTLVLDVCSLKMFSCRLMDEILPKNVEIIGTHPLFGPQSAPSSIQGMRIVLCDVRSTRINQVKEFCERLGLRVFITTPEEHDRQMAISQALTHFIGQVAKKMNVKRVELSTKTFDDLMNIIDIIKNDTPALFENMQTMNPFASEMRKEFIRNSIELDQSIKCINSLN